MQPGSGAAAPAVVFSSDTPLHLKPGCHIFIRSKVPWLDD
jgi:hypothetical protein